MTTRTQPVLAAKLPAGVRVVFCGRTCAQTWQLASGRTELDLTGVARSPQWRECWHCTWCGTLVATTQGDVACLWHGDACPPHSAAATHAVRLVARDTHRHAPMTDTDWDTLLELADQQLADTGSLAAGRLLADLADQRQ